MTYANRLSRLRRTPAVSLLALGAFLAAGCTGWREKKRFDGILDQTWADFRKDPAVDVRVAQALQKILWDEPESAQHFRAEAVKLLAPDSEPDVPALASLYNERLKWDKLWGKETPPPWEDPATPPASCSCCALRRPARCTWTTSQ